MKRSFGDHPFVVIGGGIMGLSIARELAGRGAHVTVIERERQGGFRPGQATRASLGVLGAPHGTTSPMHRLTALAHGAYSRLAADLVRETGVDPGYRQSGSLRLLERVVSPEARARREKAFMESGVAVRWLEAEEIRSLVPGVSSRFANALEIPAEAIVHPVDLSRALRASCEKRGVRFVDDSGAARLSPAGDVELEKGDVLRGATAVVAAGAWSTGVAGAGAPEVRPVRGQAMEIRLAWTGPNLRFAGPVPGFEYHIVGQKGAAWLGSTVEDAGFDPDVTEEGVAELLAAGRQVLPDLGKADIVRTWVGLRPQARRPGGPFLGRLPGQSRAWIASGHYRSGILLGPMSARLLVDDMAEDEEAMRADGMDPETWKAFSPER